MSVSLMGQHTTVLGAFEHALRKRKVLPFALLDITFSTSPPSHPLSLNPFPLPTSEMGTSHNILFPGGFYLPPSPGLRSHTSVDDSTSLVLTPFSHSGAIVC